VIGKLDGADIPRVVMGDLGWWLRWEQNALAG
jgi:hypothetical protein